MALEARTLILLIDFKGHPILADELTITVLTSLVPLVIPLPIMMLGIFAGSVQALIFSTLAAAYITEALE